MKILPEGVEQIQPTFGHGWRTTVIVMFGVGRSTRFIRSLFRAGRGAAR